MPTRPAKRARRNAKQERSRQTVDVLLEAAARVLVRRGYAAATTNRIAEAAGVSVGTLYEYFADKDAIFDALIQRQIEALVAAVQSEALDPEVAIGVTLGRMLRLALRAMPHGPEFLRALEQVPGSALRWRLLRARAQVVEYLRQMLDARRQELRVTDLDLAAFLVVSSVEGIAMNASREMFDERLADEIGTFLNFYLTGADVRAS